jgi:PhzF family phenazine biosynthesis protein
MQLKIFQVDAFTNQLFGGNPAAVVPLEKWPADEILQNIAAENNLSETAFFIRNQGRFDLRWFTPTTEVKLCGHATLAAAHVLWQQMGYQTEEISFQTHSGLLLVKKEGDFYTLDFPTDKLEKVELPEIVSASLDVAPLETFKGREDYLVVLESEDAVASLKPNFQILGKLEARGVIATAPGRETDFVSRCFFPFFGIDEDPVTGSAHTTLTPYWAKRLEKPTLTARQISKRGGALQCRLEGDRTYITGQAVTFLIGTITI